MSSCKCLRFAPLCYQKESVTQINVVSERAVLACPLPGCAQPLAALGKGLLRLHRWARACRWKWLVGRC